VILCLVTDRRRSDPVVQARRAAAAGIDLIQVRERDLEAAALAALVRAVVHAVEGSATRVLVNDRLDVALVCGAHGVHLRSDSIPPDRARAIAPDGFLVGRSVHEPGEAVRVAAHVDWVSAGTLFETSSKSPGHARLGLAGLHEIARSVRVPVLAIGGVTPDRLGDIAASGAAGVAAIGLFTDVPGPSVVAGWRARFDSVRAAS
jgi:thiamine-phosphate pyrophosphorylase